MSTHRPSLNGSIGLGLVFKSITNSFKGQHARSSDPIHISPTVVGGGVDLQLLLDRLNASNSWQSRQIAADRLASSLDTYVVSSIPELWYLARDMIAVLAPLPCRKTALRLLLKCLRLDEYLVGSRIAYWNDIYHNCSQDPVDPHIDRFIDAISILTDNGKDSFDYCRFDNNLGAYLLAVIAAIPSDHKSLPLLLRLVANCIDNNLVGLGESRVSQILVSVRQYSSRPDPELLNACLRVFQACASVLFWPQPMASSLLECVCRSIAFDQKLVALTVLDSLSARSLVDLFTSLCDIVADTQDEVLQCGAVYALSYVQVLTASRNTHGGDHFTTLTLRSLEKALASKRARVTMAWLECMRNLLSRESYPEAFGVSTSLVSQVLPFSLWYGQVSVFTLLESITDLPTDSIALMRAICAKLTHLYTIHDISAPRDSLINFLLHNGSILDFETASFVLDLYYADKKCTLLDPLRAENIVTITNSFFHHRPVPIQLAYLRVIRQSLDFEYSAFGVARVDFSHALNVFPCLSHECDGQVASEILQTLFVTVGSKCTPKSFATICENIRLVLLDSEREKHSHNHLNLIAERASTLFVTFVATNQPEKAISLYELLLSIARHALLNNFPVPLLTVCKCLVRLRCTRSYHVYLTQPTDMIGLANTFKRHLSGDKHAQWLYPETPAFIPEQLLDVPCAKLVCDPSSSHCLDISQWFGIILDIMDSFIHWEVYSYIVAHFCAQLSNLFLFDSCRSHIVRLRGILCGQLTLRMPPSLILSLPANINKADVQAALVRNVLPLMGYHHHFSKQDTDEIVNALIFGLSAWDKMGVPCINILTVCCYMMPLSIKKYLLLILAKLQSKISSAYTMAHTLEFLLALYRVPTLTLNFTADEYKRVIAILFKFIESSTEKSVEPVAPLALHAHGADATIEEAPSTADTGQFLSGLRRYTICLAYAVMFNWFLKISIDDRKLIVPFMILSINQLASQSQEDPLLSRTRTASCLDFIDRFSCLDVPIRFRQTHRDIKYQHWLMRTLILSVAQDGQSMVVRRPTGGTPIDVSCHADNAETLLHLLYNALDLADAPQKLPPADESFLRAIKVLDRTPAAELHKIGVVYIGPGQTGEEEVLSNCGGLAEYTHFLEGLGPLLRLKGAQDAYLGGLDPECDMDGQYTRHWLDHITQVVFHVATMMTPNVQPTMKKRHIGNNYTNIYFDESGHPFDFNILRLQFTFLSIVISAHTQDDARVTLADPMPQPCYYKVKTYRRSGVPAVFATCHYKLIGRDHLARYVRDLVITANTLALAWHASGDDFSLMGWLARAQQILRIHEMSHGREQ